MSNDQFRGHSVTAYRTFIAEVERRFRWISADSAVPQFAAVEIRIIPREAGIVIRVDDSLSESVKPWKQALTRGLQAAISEQVTPVDGFEVRIIGIDTHPHDTNEFAVENCARAAILDALHAGGDQGTLIEREYDDE